MFPSVVSVKAADGLLDVCHLRHSHGFGAARSMLIVKIKNVFWEKNEVPQILTVSCTNPKVVTV